jgi:hypothetical protein
MFRRYAYILFLTAMAATLKMGSRTRQVDEDLDWAEAIQPTSTVFTVYDQDRRELLEAMDQIVDSENYYRSVSGRFTLNLSDLEFVLPETIQGRYEVGVSEATDSRLLVAAYSLKTERLESGSDQASIDQFYHLTSNFPVPVPRAEYLRARAERHLKELANMPRGQILAESGVFHGYFRYDPNATSSDGEDRRNPAALGVRPPVLGFKLTLSGNDGAHSSTWMAHWVLGEHSATQDATPEAGLLRDLDQYARIGSDLETIANAEISAAPSDRRVAGKVSNFGRSQHDLVIEKIDQ